MSTDFPAPSTTIQLQSVGEHHALTVAELTVGCVTVWNYGSAYVVTGIERVSKCFVNVSMVKVEWQRDGGYSRSGDTWVRRMKLSRAVGYSPKTSQALAEQVSTAA